MDITINEENGKYNVTIEGRLDTMNAQEFGDRLIPLVKSSESDVTIDCTRLDYISSSGLRQLLILLKRATSLESKLRLKQMKPEIREIFDITGLSSLFCIEP